MSSDRLEKIDNIDTDVFITLLPIRPYEQVCIIGCENISICVSIAKYVTQGKLYVFDNDKKLIERCAETMDNIRLTNVQIATYEDIDQVLEDITLDGTLINSPYRIANDTEQLITGTHGRLVTNGWLALLEDCYTNADLRLISERVGFKHVSTRRLLEDMCLGQFRK